MIVYFENSKGKRKELGVGDNERECMKIIDEFLKEHNFKSYYTRSWKVGNEIVLDVGSHTEFFYIVED